VKVKRSLEIAEVLYNEGRKEVMETPPLVYAPVIHAIYAKSLMP